MKWNYKIWIISILFAHTTISQAQVTIGLESQPQKGALLDLKEQEATTAGGVTSEKGLLLPRVELQDLAKLQMGASSPDLTATGALEHTGLWVYNVTDKDDICPGVYVWDGALWRRLDDGCWTLNLDKVGPLYFASGRSGSVITPQSVLVSWNPTTATLNVTDVDTSFTTHPLATGQTGGSTSLSIEPDAMSLESIEANPFAIKESQIKLETNQDGRTLNTSITVNQINKALILGEIEKDFSSSKIGETNTVTTNADFKVTRIPSSIATDDVGANAIRNVKLDGQDLPFNTPVTGFERNDGTGKQGNLVYDLTKNPLIAAYSYLIFSDTQTPARFSNVTLTVRQCDVVVSLRYKYPTIEEWALIAGFSQTDIDAVKETGVDSRILPNGIQMHRTAQETPRGVNQIFLSSNYGADSQGSDERWMLQNYDAISYDTDVTYVGSDQTVLSTNKLPKGFPSSTTTTPTSYNTLNNRYSPPYDYSQRAGLVYTYYAATAGVEGGSEQIQGICPNGWHLPNENDWLQLFASYEMYMSEFANTPKGASFVGNIGVAMLEVCEIIGTTTDMTYGMSHSISSGRRPGFETIHSGYGYMGQTTMGGGNSNIWSSTKTTGTYGQKAAWTYMSYNGNIMANNVLNYLDISAYLASVRCKKNN